jgi:Ran GTPase-activating protein (RanGAP) involved in mRNA processing and transport
MPCSEIVDDKMPTFSEDEVIALFYAKCSDLKI